MLGIHVSNDRLNIINNTLYLNNYTGECNYFGISVDDNINNDANVIDVNTIFNSSPIFVKAASNIFRLLSGSQLFILHSKHIQKKNEFNNNLREAKIDKMAFEY